MVILLTIRQEIKTDYREVENLVRESFWNIYRPGCYEHYIIHNMRYAKSFIKQLDYLIEEDNYIIAHIVYANGKIHSNNESKTLPILGPVSVHPKYQKQGYGSKIINYTLKKAEEMGYPGIIVVGDEKYYSRFGFEKAFKYNIHYEGMDRNDEAPFFMIKVFDKNKINDYQGIFSNPESYTVDIELLNEFDKAFPPKIKEKIEGQLE